MRHVTKTTLLGSAAGMVLALGMAAPAAAFENLEWTWNKTINENVVKRITVESTIVPSGMTEVEKLQLQIGDVNATSVVNGIENNPIREGAGENGTITVDETFQFETVVDEGNNDVLDPVGPNDGDDPANGITATFDGGQVNEEGDATDPVDLTFSISGEIPFDFVPTESLDAETELPAVLSEATAVGNNQSIYSEVSTQLHDGQFLFDTCGECGEGGTIGALPVLPGQDGEGGNQHTDVALAVAVGAVAGTIDKANIDAYSEVFDILNATVDSSATAVGNNMNVEVAAETPGDALLLADIHQVSVADVSAQSYVYDVQVNGYSNLAAVSPIVSSTATAVGNNLNISVSSPNAVND